MRAAPILTAEDLKAYYVTNAFGVERTVKAVDGVSIAVRPGEIYGIAGESGCGKSSLLKVLLGAYDPPLEAVGGRVTYDFGDGPRDVISMSEKEVGDVRWSHVSYVPQGSMHVLNPVRRIGDIFHDFISTHRPMKRREADAMVTAYLGEFGLREGVLRAFPHQLSGGMRQRVTIALATILSPRLIFADEPTTALDVVVQRAVIQLLKRIQRENGSTLVLITHDMGVQANLADRVAVLYAGKLVEEAPTRTIFKGPRHPYTQHLIGSLPTLDDKMVRESLPGRPPALDDPPPGCRFHPRCPHAMDICRSVEPPLVTVGDDHRAACHLISQEDIRDAATIDA